MIPIAPVRFFSGISDANYAIVVGLDLEPGEGSQRARPSRLVLGGERHLQTDLRLPEPVGRASELLLARLAPGLLPRPNHELGLGRQVQHRRR